MNPLLKDISRSRIALTVTILTLLFMTGAPVAQDMSAEAIWTYDGDWPTKHIEIADLNGDSIGDVIGGESSNDYYGDPHKIIAIDGATGDTLWTYQLQDACRSMTIGDLNNDNVMDVIAGASYNASGTPDGYVHAIDGATGGELWTFYTGATNTAVCTGDFNGDEFLDVASCDFDENIYAINGRDGSQIWVQTIDALWVNDIASGDVNGDHLDDVAFAHEYLSGWDNYFGVLSGANGSVIWDSTTTMVMLDAMIADIDNDTELEAVFSGISDIDEGWVLVLDAGDGEPEWDFNLGPIDHTNGEIGLHLLDIDDDTDDDLVISNNLGWRKVIAFDGTGPTIMFESDSLSGYPGDYSLGDVTGDEQVELVAATYDRIQVISPTTGGLIYHYAVDGTIYAVDCADFDDDKIVDIAAGGYAENSGWPPDPGKTIWGLRTSQSPLLWEYNFGEYGNAIACADINGDGADDPIAVASLDDWVWVIDGAAGDEVWHWTGTQNLYAVTTGDFNNDDTIDVAVAGNDDMVTAVDGRDGSVLWQFTDPGDQIYRKCLQSADLNFDGNADVVAGADDGYIYAISGSTTKADVIWSRGFTGGDAEEVELAEMNGFAPIDVVAIVGGKMVVLDGSDGATIWEYDIGTSSARSCEVLDANDDGVPDVAIAINSNPGKLILVDGITHTEVWSVDPFYPTYEYALSHGWLNDDKADDLIAGGNSSNKTVYAFDGVTGAEIWNYPTGGEVNSVLGADVNGDEIVDVMAGSDDGHFYAFDGATGDVLMDYSCADDVMQVTVGDINGDGALNMACVTFGSDGIVYAFKSLYSAGCCNSVGDIDYNGGGPDIADLVYLVSFMFEGGPEPPCFEAADTNGDGNPVLDITDLLALVEYMFLGGDPLPECP